MCGCVAGTYRNEVRMVNVTAFYGNNCEQITDLGMAKRLMSDDIVASCTNSSSRMMGTFGYFAPEYAIVGKASLKSDVFSFGVVVLELITGRQPIQKTDNGDDESLVMWVSFTLNFVCTEY